MRRRKSIKKTGLDFGKAIEGKDRGRRGGSSSKHKACIRRRSILSSGLASRGRYTKQLKDREW